MSRAIRAFLALWMVLGQILFPLTGTGTAFASGGSYSVNWTAADPDASKGPFTPTYAKVSPSQQVCPAPSGSSGRATDPMANAIFGNPRDSVESLAPPSMALGQIVPFEVKLSVSGSTSPENGTIEFSPYWLAKTTSGDNFGYEPSYGVYCAFVDASDAGNVDPGANAKVDSFAYTIANTGTNNEQIQGNIKVSGLNTGDSVIVEVWVVLKNNIPAGSTGNIQTGLLSAKTVAAAPETINTGNQTVPLLRVQEFFSSNADTSVTKTDNADPVTPGSTFSYSIVVKNNATGTVANGIVVTDQLPAYTSFVPASSSDICSASSSTVSCNVGALGPGQSTTLIISVQVASNAPTSGTLRDGSCTVGATGVDLCNSVSVSSITTDPNTANNSDSEPTDVQVLNHPPVAADDSATTAEDTAKIIAVLANDSDADGNLSASTLKIVSSPANGLVKVNADGTITYTPNGNFSGVDTFVYEICDTTGLCDTATVTVTVSAVNDKPVAISDAYSTSEDTTLTIASPGVLANDSDVDGDTLSVSGITQPAHGSVSLNADGSFSYTPNANYNGTDTFTYTISDGNGGSDTATVTIEVVPANDAPLAADDTYSTNEDTSLTIMAPGVLANDSDIDGNSLTVSSNSPAANGTVTLNADGSFSYTPNADFTGIDSFTYTVIDGEGSSATATVTINVLPVNDPPVAVNDTAETSEDAPVTIAVLPNDSDIDGDTLTVVSATQPANGAVVVNADGTITYTPNANYTGQDSFTYTISDGNGGTATATVTIDIATVNDAPVAADDSASTAEEAPVTVSVLSNDSDADGDTLTISIAVDPANGVAVVNADGTITYTPNENFNGVDTFEYQICDPSGLCDTAFVTVTVTQVNDAPVAANDSYSTNEDTVLTVPAPGILENDSDIDGDNLSVSGHSQPAHGTLTQNADGSLSYTPAANFHGEDSFTYEISDGNGGTATATVTITVNPVNDAPVAVNNSYTTAEDTVLTIDAPGVLGNDNDSDGDSLTVTAVTPPAHGSVSQNADGSFNYTPDANYNGQDSFTYTISDGNGGTDTATVIINVTPVNDPPVALDDSTATNEDMPKTIKVLGNDSDVDGNLDPSSVSIVSNPANGTVEINADGTITYTPNANFYGNDSFAYEVCDTNGLCAQATVNIVVNPVNDAPVANNDSYSTAEDTLLTIDVPGVLVNDSDVDGDPLTATVLNGPSHGTLTQNENGSFSYQPDANYNGADSFTYIVSDGKGGWDIATVSIEVLPTNDAPVAQNDSATTDEDASVTIPVLGNDTDADGDSLTVESVGNAAHGSVTINADGTITYTPDANYNGTDSFTYTVCDSSGACDTATVTITVNSVNDAPVAVDDSVATPEDAPVTINVLENDSDVDGNLDPSSVSIIGQPEHGSVTVNADGTITYTPNANYNGADSFTYQVCDLAGVCDTATVTVGVATVNDPPVASDDSTSTPEDAPVTINVLSNDSDLDGNLDASSVSIIGQPEHGSVTVNADGTITYTPDANYNGPDSFTYQVCDLGAPVFCASASVSVSVTPVNDAPVASPDNANTNEDAPVTIDVLSNDSDLDGDTLTIESVTPPANGTVEINDNGTITYTPNANFNGEDSFTYTVCDPSGACSTTTVTVNVAAVNDAPVANDDEYNTAEDTLLTIAAPGVLENDTDIDGDTLTVSVISEPTNGTLTQNADGSFSYMPNANYNGTDSFTYQACDPTSACETATVIINITAVNDAPVAVDDSYSTNEDSVLTIASVAGVLSNDVNVDADTLTVSSYTQPKNGSVTLNPNGSFTYTPAANSNETDTFTYTVCDSSGLCDEATVTITINPTNDNPVAANDAYSTSEGTTLIVPVTSGVIINDSDIDGDTLTVSSYSQPSNGTLELNPDGSLSYTPKADFSGTDSFSYTVSDGQGGTATATVTITVNDVMPSVSVTKSPNLSSVLFSGNKVTYTVVVKNTSSEPVALSVLVDDKFGSLDRDTTAAHTWISSTCDVPQTIALGGSYTCSFTANVSGTAGSSHINVVTATISDNENNTVSGAGQATVKLFWRGRTPGYWKNHSGSGQWPQFSVNGVAVTPNTLVTQVFAVPSSLLKNGMLDLNSDGKADTLLVALSYKGGDTLGGSVQILLRAGVSGLLNEQYFGNAYPAYSSVSALITSVNSTMASLNRGTIINRATLIDNWNNGVH